MDKVGLLAEEHSQDSEDDSWSLERNERVQVQNYGHKCRCTWLMSLYRRIFPHGYCSEFKILMKMTWPMILTQFSDMSVLVVSLIFCGHLGKETLDGVAIATTLINIFGFCVMYGLSTALDTLFSQVYGSANKHRVGIILQRGFLILLLACLPSAAVLMNAEYLMITMGQHPAVAKLGGVYAFVSILGLPASTILISLKKYLQAQSIVFPSLLISFAVNIVNAILHTLFLYGLNMGIKGAALSVCLSYWTSVLFHVVYIICSAVYKTTWNGLTKECLADWNSFMVLAFPGLLMIILEWASFEILIFIVGFLPESILGAYVLTSNIAVVSLAVPIGISTAAGVRVGNLLGASKPKMALTASRVAISIGILAAILNGIILLSIRSVLPKLYTNDREITSKTTSMIPQLALFSLFDFTQFTASGIIRGVGFQKFGAIINLIAYYVIALPVSIPLTLKTSLTIHGTYIGMTCSTFFQAVSYLLRIKFTNWKKEATKAQVRSGVIETEINTDIDSKLNQISDEEQCNSKHNDRSFEHSVVDEDSEQDAKKFSSTDEVKYEFNITSDGAADAMKRNYTSIYLSRLAILLLDLMILAGGIVSRVYLKCDASSPLQGVLQNSTIVNQTFIHGEVLLNQSALSSVNL